MGDRPFPPGTVNRYQQQALELLRAALDEVPVTQRKAFWRDTIQKERDLDSLRRHPDFLQLGRTYAL